MAQFHYKPNPWHVKLVLIGKDTDETGQVLMQLRDLLQDAELVIEFMRKIIGRETNDFRCSFDTMIDSFRSIDFAIGAFAEFLQ